MTLRTHHHRHAEAQRGATYGLPTEAESRQMLAQIFPSYAYWLATRNEIKLLPAPVIAGLLPAPKPIEIPLWMGQITIRNGRQGKIHRLMSNGNYRVYVLGTGLPFPVVEYYTVEELSQLNPVWKKAA